MNETRNQRLTANARALRKNMTKQERHLWYDFLKGLPVMVHRQKVIGQYIVDFYISDANLRSLGLTVLRYSNADIDCRFCSVCEDIWNRLKISEKKASP